MLFLVHFGICSAVQTKRLDLLSSVLLCICVQKVLVLRSGSQKKYRQNRKYGSPGLVVMGRDSKVIGSNPGTVYCMDIFHIHLL